MMTSNAVATVEDGVVTGVTITNPGQGVKGLDDFRVICDKKPVFHENEEKIILKLKSMARRVTFWSTKSTFKIQNVVVAGGMFARAIQFLDNINDSVSTLPWQVDRK